MFILHGCTMETLYLLAVALLVVSVLGEIREKHADFLRIQHKRLNGYVLQTLEVVFPLECHSACLHMSGCKSENLKPTGDRWMTCELLNNTGQQASQLVDDSGAFFFGKFNIHILPQISFHLFL